MASSGLQAGQDVLAKQVARGAPGQGRKLLLHFLHFRHPWRSDVLARRPEALTKIARDFLSLWREKGEREGLAPRNNDDKGRKDLVSRELFSLE
ncbi:hypothetical protein BTW08_05290 [Salinicola sp. MH3R3-1]|uniref:hypothetical protein n=1 Tax=Salinicola sp. MH3R3-1 TaxID=1928762 RepID=UPI00094E4EE9|nr:hypothetical protein [Salinicola sp. MH3R3-1]OLO08735.1 hypothetical protein BTW08_05290 [Salinicola sp. MH3R3-1]